MPTLGKKSNRKKQLKLLHLPNSSASYKRGIAGALVFFGAILLYSWSSSHLDKSFIPTRVLLLVLVPGAVAGVLFFAWLWSVKEDGLKTISFFGIIAGSMLSYFSLVATNFYFKKRISQTILLPILKTGNHYKKYHCAIPYAQVELEEIPKKITFSCDYETSIIQYKTVELTISQGLLGFMVITKKELKP